MLEKINDKLISLHNNKLFESLVIAVIILSSLLIGAKTYNINHNYLIVLEYLDTAVTLFFLTEIVLRFLSWQHKLTFFKNGWNLFDFLIVTISLIPINESEFILLARLIRIFRVLRLVSAIPELRKLVTALIKALPSMGYVVLMMFILFYIYATVGSFLFADINSELWGNITISMLTLFRVITFEDWTDVMYETMQQHKWSWIYYLSFIFFNAFVFLNMMIGIIIEKMNISQAKDRDNLLKQINEKLYDIEQKIKK